MESDSTMIKLLVRKNSPYKKLVFETHNQLIGCPDVQSMASQIFLRQKLQIESQRIKSAHSLWRRWCIFRRKYLKNKKSINELNCYYCKKTLTKIHNKGADIHPNLATLDHIVPISKGGSRFDEDNIVVSCITCNIKKGNIT